MEINPVRPVQLETPQGRGQVAARPAGPVHGYSTPTMVDAVDDFSLTLLLKMADAALAGGNSATALEQYVRLLQYEPDNVRALYGKILAEAGQSPANLKESLGKLELLLKRVPDAERESLLARAGEDIVALGKKVEVEALATLLKEITPLSYGQFAERMEQVLQLYQNGALLLPTREGTLMAMIAAAERLMAPQRDQKSGKRFYPSEGIYEKGKRWLQRARELLKKSFPSRFKRLLLYKKYQTCFIATAAWGDSEAEEVMALRAFRELYLRNNPLGRRFIVLYYRHGGTIAGLIAESSILRMVVRGLLSPFLWGIRLLPGMRMRRFRYIF